MCLMTRWQLCRLLIQVIFKRDFLAAARTLLSVLFPAHETVTTVAEPGSQPQAKPPRFEYDPIASRMVKRSLAGLLVLASVSSIWAAGSVDVMDPITRLGKRLTGGEGITISNGTISATGTASAFVAYTSAGGGRVTENTFTNYTSDISPRLALADTALQPGDSRLWVDEAGYHRAPNRTDSGNTIMRVYDDGGAIQVGNPARAQGLGGDVPAGSAQQLKVGHGSTGTPSTVIAPVAYVEKVTGASTANGSYDTAFQALNYKTANSNANMQAIVGTVQHQYGGTGDSEAIHGRAFGSAAGQSGSSMWGVWGLAYSGVGDYIGATGAEFNVINEHSGGNYGLHTINYDAAGAPRGYTRVVTAAMEGDNDVMQGIFLGKTATSVTGRMKTGVWVMEDSVQDFDGTYNEVMRLRGTTGVGTGPQGILLTDKFESGLDTSGATIVGNKAIKLAASHVITDGTNSATAAQLRDATKIQGTDIPAPAAGDDSKYIQYNNSSGDFQYAAIGNAATATALAANGTNCSAGQYPLGVDAGGNAESCTAASGTPGGTSGQIQYNNSSSFGGITSMVDAGGIAIGVNTTANAPLTLYSPNAVPFNGTYMSRASADLASAGRYNLLAISNTNSTSAPHASSSLTSLDLNQYYNGTGTLPKLMGAYISARNTGASGTITALEGQEIEMRVSSTGIAGNMYGLRVVTPTNAGTVSTSVAGVLIGNQVPTGGNTIPATYGVRIEDQSGAKSSSPYSLFTGLGEASFGDFVSLRNVTSPSATTDRVKIWNVEGDYLHVLDEDSNEARIGQKTLSLGAASGGTATLESTSHATKGLLTIPNAVDITSKLTTLSTGETVKANGTCSTSINIDPDLGGIHTLTLSGACAIGVTNLTAGESFTLKLTQSSTTAPTFTSAYKWPAGTAPTWSTTATKYDVLSCYSDDGTTLLCNGMVDVR